MNSKTATLLNRWAIATGAPKRIAKKLWKNTPRNRKGWLRDNIEEQLEPDQKPDMSCTIDTLVKTHPDTKFDIVTAKDGKTYAIEK